MVYIKMSFSCVSKLYIFIFYCSIVLSVKCEVDSGQEWQLPSRYVGEKILSNQTSQVNETRVKPDTNEIALPHRVPANPSENSDTEPADLECQRIVCDFEEGVPCSYWETFTGVYNYGTTKSFTVANGPFKNPHTGIWSAANGIQYAVSYLNPKDSALLMTDVPFLDDRRVTFKYYKATQDITLDACCDRITDCLYKANRNAKKSDFKHWRTGELKCPKGTQKLIFHSKNEGRNEGAIGLDDIRLSTPDKHPLCQEELGQFQVIDGNQFKKKRAKH